jgi:prepilin-type N-terminal cleavage/methylation domain-containing protein
MLRQRGFSLTELMVGSTVGLLVIAGALQLYVVNIRATSDTVRLSRLNQELRGTLDLLTFDLRRAGYWAFTPDSARPTDNPFQADGNDVQLGNSTGEPDNSCILYSYDLNNDSRVGVGPSGVAGPTTSSSNLEQFGFRLRAGQIQMRNGGSPFTCTSGSWQAITDADTEVTSLQFGLQQTCINLVDVELPCTAGDPGMLRRNISISLRARSRSDTTISHQLTNSVALANDKLLIAVP